MSKKKEAYCLGIMNDLNPAPSDSRAYVRRGRPGETWPIIQNQSQKPTSLPLEFVRGLRNIQTKPRRAWCIWCQPASLHPVLNTWRLLNIIGVKVSEFEPGAEQVGNELRTMDPSQQISNPRAEPSDRSERNSSTGDNIIMATFLKIVIVSRW